MEVKAAAVDEYRIHHTGRVRPQTLSMCSAQEAMLDCWTNRTHTFTTLIRAF